MLTQVPTPRSSFLSFSFIGTINLQDRKYLMEIIEKEMKKSRAIRIYLEFKIGRWEAVKDFWNTLQVYFAYLKHIEKLAIAVSGEVKFHIEPFLKTENEIQIRMYDPSQRSEAYNWLK